MGSGMRKSGGRFVAGARAALVLAALEGCATAGGAGARSGPERSGVDVDGAIAALQQAETAFEAREFTDAERQADSLFRAWDGRSSLVALADRALWLQARSTEAQGRLGDAAEAYDRLIRRDGIESIRNEAIGRYVEVLGATGREDEAVDAALAFPGVLDPDRLDGLRQWVASLPMDALRERVAAYPPQTVEASILHAQLAQALIAAGDTEAARQIARGILSGQAGPTERDLAQLLVSAGEDIARRATIGAILPLTGELQDVGELLREGIELALESYRRARPEGLDIELLIRDDRSNPEATAALVAELEREGVVAILGPLRSESFAAAARARRNPRLPIISPTATEVLGSAPDAYTLYDQVARQTDVAVDLARWTVEELGLRRVAVLQPISGAEARSVAAFERAIEDAGGTIVGRASYDPSETTFEGPIASLARVQPDVVFVPATTPQVVLTLAPQLSYFGLDRSIIVGNETWADPTVLRRLEGFAADYHVVGLSTDRVSAGTRWQEFVNQYEMQYRKSLRDNLLPGLAYDAMALALVAIEGAGLPIPAAIATYLASGVEVPGVTGVLRAEPGASTVHRDTEVRMVVGGELVPADRSALLGWLAEARAAEPRDPFENRR